MDNSITRRTWLKYAAGTAAAGGMGALGWWGISTDIDATKPHLSEAEVIRLLAKPGAQATILDTTADLLRGGVTPLALLSAVFHAPILTASDQGDVHATLVTDAIRVLTRAGSPRERLMPVFWAMEFASAWVRDTTLEPLPRSAKAATTAAARRALFQALDTQNTLDAEANAVALFRHAGLDSALGALAVAACVSLTDPHRVIYVAQAARGLSAFGTHHAEPVLRSVTRYLSRTATPRQGDAILTRHMRLLEGPAPTWEESPNADDASTRMLWSMLRPGEDDDASSLIADMLNSGASAHTMWDAIILTALESLMADTSISGMGVHLTTLVDALCFAYASADTPQDRRLIMLQGAAWTTRLSQLGDRLDTLTPLDAPADLDALRRQTHTSPQEVPRRALGWAQTPARRQTFVEGLVSATALGATDPHDFKVVAAALALMEHLSPAWRPQLLAALSTTHGWQGHDRWPGADQAAQAIATLA